MPNSRVHWIYEPDRLGRIDRGEWVPAADRFAPRDEVKDADPEVAELRLQWQQGDGPDLKTLVDFEDAVGRGQPNRRGDVARLVLALNRHGFYELDTTAGPTGWWGVPQEEALLRFQRAKGLTPDRYALKKGETAVALTASPIKFGDAFTGVDLVRMNPDDMYPGLRKYDRFASPGGGGFPVRPPIPRAPLPAPPIVPPPPMQNLLDMENSRRRTMEGERPAGESPYERQPWYPTRSPLVPPERVPTPEETGRNACVRAARLDRLATTSPGVSGKRSIMSTAPAASRLHAGQTTSSQESAAT
jgi:hypothetical protein